MTCPNLQAAAVANLEIGTCFLLLENRFDTPDTERRILAVEYDNHPTSAWSKSPMMSSGSSSPTLTRIRFSEIPASARCSGVSRA